MYCDDKGGKSRMRCLMCEKRKEESDHFFDYFYEKDPLCYECRKKWIRCKKKRKMDTHLIHSSWIYNEAYAECLIQYKECFDEALQDVFLFPVKNTLKRKYWNRTVILLPSSNEKIEKRGFHHLEKMYSSLGLPMINPFIKKENVDQKGKGSKGREEIQNVILLKENISFPKRVLIVDDVMTTGCTLRACLRWIPKECDIQIYVNSMSVKEYELP